MAHRDSSIQTPLTFDLVVMRTLMLSARSTNGNGAPAALGTTEIVACPVRTAIGRHVDWCENSKCGILLVMVAAATLVASFGYRQRWLAILIVSLLALFGILFKTMILGGLRHHLARNSSPAKKTEAMPQTGSCSYDGTALSGAGF
jgi:predicted phage tail protein